MIRPLLLAAIGAVSLALAAPAHADPDSDYLDMLSNYDGMNIDSFAVNGQSGAQMLTLMGRAACGELRQGESLRHVANDLLASDLLKVPVPTFTQKQAGDVVEAAQQYVC